MASTDAKPVPQKNVAYRVTFPILDADGDLVTGAAGLDSQISKDGGTFAACTNEATEIATSSGVYYLDLTSTEMNADTVAIIVKTSTSGAKTTTIVMYPEETGDIRVNVTAYGGTAGTFASGRPEVNTTHIAGSAVSTSSAQIGVNVVNAGGTAWGSGAITAASIATDAITNAKIAADAIGASEIADGAIDAGAIATGAITAAKFAAGAIDAAAIAADAIGASELAADAATEIANAVWALDATGQQTQGTFGQVLGDSTTTAESVWTRAGNIYSRIGAPVGASISADVAAVQSDTDNIQTRIPAALVSGRIDASVGEMQAGTIGFATFSSGSINASALATDAAQEIAAAVAAQAVTACTAVPAANDTIGVVLGYILAELRNLKTLNRTTGVETLKQDDGTTNIGTRTVSDDGTTFTRPELA